MSIDAEKLEEAIRACGERTGVPDQIFDSYPHAWISRAHLKVLEAAARAHHATLLGYKEVEVWRVEFAQSKAPFSATFDTLVEAERYQEIVRGWPNITCIQIVPHRQKVPA